MNGQSHRKGVLIVNISRELALVNQIACFGRLRVNHDFLDYSELAEEFVLAEYGFLGELVWQSDYIQNVVPNYPVLQQVLDKLFLFASLEVEW